MVFDKDLNEGGACPDFVALDLQRREVVVVEITSASNVQPILNRVAERQARWFSPILRHLTKLGILGEGWQRPRFLGFIRYQNYELAKRRSAAMDDVAFYPIEAATFAWEYWDDRMRDGLPDRDTVLPVALIAARNAM